MDLSLPISTVLKELKKFKLDAKRDLLTMFPLGRVKVYFVVEISTATTKRKRRAATG